MQYICGLLIIDFCLDGTFYEPIGIEHVSPNSGLRVYVPDVPAAITPFVGMLFDTIEHTYSFYRNYAIAGGWEIRRGGEYAPNKDKTVLNKFFVCSKEGFKKFKPVDTFNDQGKKKITRRKPSKRCGCKAEIRLKLQDSKYVVNYFKSEHNHSFVAKEDVHLLTSAREMTYTQQQAIGDLSSINLGPVRAFNIMRTLNGGFDKVGATKVDFKNFRKDMNAYIGDYDAQMLVKRLTEKRDWQPNFTCEFTTSDEGTLKCLFWADDEMKKNFSTFGDVVSFDATYRRNRYNMMFVPFTGIDNHNRNVTLGAAVIGSETTETYSWLLNIYKNHMGKAPQVIVTDQDPAMKKAIEEVFVGSRHRLCMWHIMDKLTSKVGYRICNTTDFKKKLSKIVWTDALDPEEFEKEWDLIMNGYKLVGNDWLSNIYNVRQDWIPAYYRHENMSGLMRTSSRSESENHFFGQFQNPKCTLVEFLSHFDAAIDCQRHERRLNDHQTRYTKPDLWSNFVLEHQAVNIYTRTIFLDVQLEIEAAIHKCTNHHLEELDACTKFYVKDFSKPNLGFFEVMFRQVDMSLQCKCKRYEQFGLLCSHIFHILRLCDIREFPKNYILRRWTREAVPPSRVDVAERDGLDSQRGDDVRSVVREINIATDYVINRVVSNKDVLCSFRDLIKNFMPTADEAMVNAPRKSKRDRIAELTGLTQPTELSVRVPVGTRFKGCGSHKRPKSIREQISSQAGTKQRQCSNCHGFGHNARTCTNPKANEDIIEGNSNSNDPDEE